LCVAKTKVFFYAFQAETITRKVTYGLEQARAN